MSQQAQEQKQHVHDIQVQRRCNGRKTAFCHNAVEVICQIAEAHHQGDSPQDAGMLQLISRRLDFVGLFFLIFQQGGIHTNRVLLVGMHCAHHQRQHKQDYQYHQQVHGVEDRVTSTSLISNITDGIAAGQRQRNRAGQTCMPDNKAAVGRRDNQTVVQRRNTAGHFLSQHCTSNQTKAPVQPGADHRCHSDNDNTALVGISQRCDFAQDALADSGRCQGRAQHHD